MRFLLRGEGLRDFRRVRRTGAAYEQVKVFHLQRAAVACNWMRLLFLGL